MHAVRLPRPPGTTKTFSFLVICSRHQKCPPPHAVCPFLPQMTSLSLCLHRIHFSAVRPSGLFPELGNFSHWRVGSVSSLSAAPRTPHTSQCGHLKFTATALLPGKLLLNSLWNNNIVDFSTAHIIPMHKVDAPKKPCRCLNSFWKFENFTRVL